MAIVKTSDLKNASKEDLQKRLEELELELAKERVSASIGTAKSPGKIREIRRAIARIKTIMGEK